MSRRDDAERMKAALADWQRGATLIPTGHGRDVLKVTFEDRSSGLLLWRPAARCWRLVDLAGYDADRVPTRMIENERRTA